MTTTYKPAANEKKRRKPQGKQTRKPTVRNPLIPGTRYICMSVTDLSKIGGSSGWPAHCTHRCQRSTLPLRPRLRECRSRPRGWPSLPGLPRSRPSRIALRWPETRGAPPIPGIRIFRACIHATVVSLGVRGDEEAVWGEVGRGRG